MRVVILSFLILVSTFFMACGGGDSSENNNAMVTTSESEDSFVRVDSIYDYNTNKSAARELDNIYVNQYEAIELALAKLGNDKKTYALYLDKFVLEILQLTENTDSIPSSAPRGDNKSYTASVKNGVADYYDFNLYGDVNSDYKVDFDDIDLIKNALINANNSSDYDVNEDSKVDLKDLIEIAARLNIEISYFDFYTLSGVKLAIETKTVNETKSVNYDGNKTSIMVVAKDINMASSFSDTLSDLEDVWYKKSGWTLFETVIETSTSKSILRSGGYEATDTMSQMLEKAVREVVLNVKPSSHLTGWHFGLAYINAGANTESLTMDENEDIGSGLKNMDDLFTKAENYINAFFTATDMGNPGKRSPIVDIQYAYHIGSKNDEKFVEVIGDDVSIKHTYVLGNEKVYESKILHSGSVLYLSKEDNSLSGDISSDPKINGTLKLKREGPRPDIKEYEVKVSDGKFTAKNIAYGGYSFGFETECKCKLEVKGTGDLFVFNAAGLSVSLNIEDDKLVADISIEVVNNVDAPQKQKTVEIVAKECRQPSSTIPSKISDNDGKVSFKKVPIGDYEVKVEGKVVGEVHVCQDGVHKVTISPLWSFHVDFQDPTLGGGSMSIKKFPLDFESTNQGFYAFIGNDYKSYEEGTSIKYERIYYDHGISPLLLMENYVSWNAMLFIDNYEYQVGSMEYMAGAGTCNGTLPSNALVDLQDGKIVKWTSPPGAEGTPTCVFSFEPCTNSECN